MPGGTASGGGMLIASLYEWLGLLYFISGKQRFRRNKNEDNMKIIMEVIIVVKPDSRRGNDRTAVLQNQMTLIKTIHSFKESINLVPSRLVKMSQPGF